MPHVCGGEPRVSGIQGDIGSRQQQLLDYYGKQQLDLQQTTADREGDLLRYYANRARAGSNTQGRRSGEETLDRYLQTGDIGQTDYDRLFEMYKEKNGMKK
jgi:hypothetical protein